METIKRYENFPIAIVLLSNLLSLGIYGLGFLILLKLGLIFAFLYLVYILSLEYRLIRKHCPNCYYWGKTCGFGKGKLSAWFVKKGEPAKFCSMSFTWRDMIPDILVTLIPLVAGIVLLVVKFEFILLSALIILILLTTTGNNFIRGTLTCRYCKQRDMGCPAEKLFNKEKPMA